MAPRKSGLEAATGLVILCAGVATEFSVGAALIVGGAVIMLSTMVSGGRRV